MQRAGQTLAELEAIWAGPSLHARIPWFLEGAERLSGQVDWRLLPGETIPSHEKLYSVFEPHTRWNAKGSVLIHRVALDSETIWLLPVLGIAILLCWMMSFHSATGRLSAKHAVLLELEGKLPVAFLKRENDEFNQLRVVRKKWPELLIPLVFLVISGSWLIMYNSRYRMLMPWTDTENRMFAITHTDMTSRGAYDAKNKKCVRQSHTFR